jgi:hypothetical protein
MSERPEEQVARIVESAQALGIEMDEAEAMRWLSAMAAQDAGAEIVVDMTAGVYGHRVSMLDFSPADLARFRDMGTLVGFEDRPGVVETALALSGSAAQSKIQTNPGDADFFERVNVIAPTREEACRIVAEVVREKALSTMSGDTYRLIEVKFGSYPYEVVRGNDRMSAGSPITWHGDEIRAGAVEALKPDGTFVGIRWDDVAADPGWVKLDWVVADPVRRRVANASNMLDVTWEAPDGSITPLDGFLDPYFQEVYLEAESIPIFSKLAKHVAADALEQYVAQLESEVRKYLKGETNYGKAAKRMYNVFRLTGRYPEASYLRELFDEPATVLYEAAAVVRTLDEAAFPGSDIPLEVLVARAEELILRVIEGVRDAVQAVDHLERVRDKLAGGDAVARFEAVHQAREFIGEMANEFFRERLHAVEPIRAYMEEMAAG